MLGSSVLPDVLETMQRVLFRSNLRSIALIWTGSVESSTCSAGKPLILSKVIRRTSGQRLDPPIPSSKAFLKRAAFTSSAMRLNAATCESCCSTMCNHPSQRLSSLRVQRDASFFQRRATLWFFRQSSSDTATAFARSSGSVQVCLFTLTRGLPRFSPRSEEHTSELQSRLHLVCRLLLEKKNCPPLPPVRQLSLTADSCAC